MKLAKASEIRRTLARAKDVAEVNEIRAKATALAEYERLRGAWLEALKFEGIALDAHLESGRRLLEMKKQGLRHRGGRPNRKRLTPRQSFPDLQKLLGTGKKTAQQLASRQTRAYRFEDENPEKVVEYRKTQEALGPAGAITLFGLLDERFEAEKAARRAGRLREIAEFARIEGRYPVIYADPPWRYEHVETESRAIENQYPTMDLEAMCDPVPWLGKKMQEVATPDAILFLWATSPKLAEAMQVIAAWGFTYRTSMVWIKDKIGMGYYARQRHELLLIATCGELPTPEPETRPDSVIEATRGKHSEKPATFRELIERMYPTLPRVELFLRGKPAKGWDGWGNEAA